MIYIFLYEKYKESFWASFKVLINALGHILFAFLVRRKACCLADFYLLLGAWWIIMQLEASLQSVPELLLFLISPSLLNILGWNFINSEGVKIVPPHVLVKWKG